MTPPLAELRFCRRRRRFLWIGVVLLCAVVASVSPRASAEAWQEVESKARAMLDAADALRARNEKEPLEQSIAQYRRLIVAADAARLQDIAARARLGAGVALELLGRSEEALPLVRDARTALQTLNDGARQAEALTWYAVVVNRTGDSSAAEVARTALDLARSAGDRRVEALALTAIYWTSSGSKDPGVKAGLEQAVAIQRDLKDGRGLAEALNALGLFTQGVEGPKAAIPIYEEALLSARTAGDARQTGFSLSLLGEAAFQQGQYEKAIAYDEESLLLSRRAGDRIRESDALGTLSMSLLHYGRTRASLTVLQDLLVIIRDLGNRRHEAAVINNMGLALSRLGRMTEATERYIEALELHRLNKDVGEEATTLLGLAFVRGATGDNQEYLDLSTRALALAQETGNRIAQRSAQSNSALALAALGRYAEALEQNSAALTLAHEMGIKRFESATERVQAILFSLIGNSSLAVQHSERSIALASGPAERAVNLARTAVYKAEMGDLSGARALVDEATALAAKTEDLLAIARVQGTSAILARLAGDRRQTLRLFEQELSTRQRANDISGQASVLTQLGDAHAALGNRSRALEYYRQGLSSASAAQNPAAESVALTSLMRHWRDERQPPVAVFFGKQAVNLFQQTRANLVQLDPGIQRAYVDSRAHIYRELADLLIQSGRLLEAQQVLDLLKQEEYLDFVRRGEGQQAIEIRSVDPTARESALTAQYKQIQDRIIDLGQKHGELLAIQKRTPEQEQELNAIEADLAVASDAFTQFLGRLSAELAQAAARTGNQAAAVRDAQALMPTLRELGAGTVAVYTLVTPTGYAAMIITPDARKGVEQPISQADLQKRIFDFRQALQDPRVDPRAPAQHLYNLLIGPIARDLEQARATTVLWVLDGVLRYVPVVALHDGRQYVAEKYRNVIFTPASQPNLKDLPGGRWEGLGAGVSRPTAGFSGLPAVQEELRRIFREPASTSGIMTGRLLLDDAFTADAFRSGLRDRLPVVHVASHFQLNPGDDNQSFLLMGDGSRLTVADLRRAPNIFEGVELLTISACNTGVGGGDGNGSEFESFGAWAQLNGAKAVVASLWPVADASTQEFMQAFYRARVEGGLDKAQAIQRAQLALLKGAASEGTVTSRPSGTPPRGLTGLAAPGQLPAFVPPPDAPWSHPFYWAPFVLIGNFR